MRRVHGLDTQTTQPTMHRGLLTLWHSNIIRKLLFIELSKDRIIIYSADIIGTPGRHEYGPKNLGHDPSTVWCLNFKPFNLFCAMI